MIVRAGKGGKDREIPQTARLTQILAELALVEAVQPTDHVFYSVRANQRGKTIHRERPVGEGTFARWWRRCLTEASVRYRTPHTAYRTPYFPSTRWKNLPFG